MTDGPGGTDGDADAVAAAKRAAGESAASVVADGDVVGLGSGSTAARAIDALGERVAEGCRLTGVPTSYQSRERAIEAGIPLAELDEVHVDVAIDGADEIAGADCVKGGGAAHAREKLVAADADRFHVVVDASKTADVLSHPVPLEVLPSARRPAAERVAMLGGDPELRRAARKSGPVVTDNGNLVLDCAFGAIDDVGGLAADLSAIPGALAHGLFVGMADVVHVGGADGVDVRELD